MEWTDLYLRTSLSETGPNNRIGSFGSPDIIPYGTTPVDASIFTTPQSYGRYEGGNLTENSTNFLYVRAKNASKTETLSGKSYLALSNPAIILWPGPGKWDLMNNSKGQNFSEISNVKPGEIGATTDPFQYVPKESGHRCLVSWISTVQHPIGEPPEISNATKLAEFLIKHPNYAHRNVEVIAGPPDRYTRSEPYSQNQASAKMTFGLRCKNCDGFVVSFVSGTALKSGKFIELKDTKVAGNETITYIKDYEVESGYNTLINYTYDKQGIVRNDFEISMESYLDVPPDHYLFPFSTSQKDMGIPEHMIENNNGKILLGSIGIFAKP